MSERIFGLRILGIKIPDCLINDKEAVKYVENLMTQAYELGKKAALSQDKKEERLDK